MRWYVATHARNNFKKSIAPDTREYSSHSCNKAAHFLQHRLMPTHSLNQDGTVPKMGGGAFSELDFEATRATTSFPKDQPG